MEVIQGEHIPADTLMRFIWCEVEILLGRSNHSIGRPNHSRWVHGDWPKEKAIIDGSSRGNPGAGYPGTVTL